MLQQATMPRQGWAERFGLTLTQTKYRTQLLAYPYFLASAILFLLQITFGLVIVSQYVWPTLLMNELPFNVGRATHLNLLTFWALLGLMGATYYLVPEEAETEIAWPNGYAGSAGPGIP